MAMLFWDASALVKRYTAEVGRETANAIFSEKRHHDMVSTPWGYAETYSILLRRMNGAVIDLGAFTSAVSALQSEVVRDPQFGLLSITDAHVFSSIETMRRHNLNSTDAILLTVLLEFTHSPGAPNCALISSDHRFLRAAAGEGLSTLNPEVLVPAEIPDTLARL